MTSITLDSYVTYGELFFTERAKAIHAYAVLVSKFRGLEIFYTLEDKDGPTPRVVFKVRTYKIDGDEEQEEFSEEGVRMYNEYIRNLVQLGIINQD